MGEASKAINFYTSWFCPFAQRTWMALVHKRVPFNYKETDPYDKTPELLAVNPLGMVPALDIGGQNVYESLVTMEYIEDAYPGEPRLLPQDAIGRAKARMMADYCNKRVVPVFYRMLQKKEEHEREAAKKEMLEHVRWLTKAMTELADGPFFMGDQFGFVDIVLSPWVERFYILKHHRGFEVPGSVADKDSEFYRFHWWWEAVRQVPAFRETLCDQDKLLATYQRYADDTASSHVARAIRHGTAMP